MAHYESYVSAGADDNFAWTGTSFNNNFDYLTLGYGSGSYNLSCRFTGVNIPAGATITSCDLTVVAYLTRSDNVPNCNSGLYFEHNYNPSQITSVYDFNSRPLATGVAYSNVPAMTAGYSYTTPDLSASLQNLVDDHGGTGDAVIVFWKWVTGGAAWYRYFASYEYGTYAPPRLEINYSSRRIFVTGYIG